MLTVPPTREPTTIQVLADEDSSAISDIVDSWSRRALMSTSTSTAPGWRTKDLVGDIEILGFMRPG